MTNGVPVREQQHQRDTPGEGNGVLRRKEPVKGAEGDHGEVERPDTKDSPHIKRWDKDGVGMALFA